MKLTQMIEKFAKQGMLNGVARAELLQAAEEMADCPALEKGYAAGFRDAAAQLAHLRESAADGWDAMGAAVPKFPSLRPVRGEEERKVRA